VGQGTAGVSSGMTRVGSNGAVGPSSREATRRLDHDIGSLREELSTLVAELKRRRHDALDVRLQLQRHAAGIGVAVAGAIVAAAATAWLGARRARQRGRFTARAGRLRRAVARMVDQPERVAAPRPSLITQIATAGATAIVVGITRRVLNRVLARVTTASLPARERSSLPPRSAAPRATYDAGMRPGAPGPRTFRD
jgi:hypothetical protein